MEYFDWGLHKLQSPNVLLSSSKLKIVAGSFFVSGSDYRIPLFAGRTWLQRIRGLIVLCLVLRQVAAHVLT